MIDWERVQILREEVGDEGFPLIVALFLEEVEETILRLRASVNTARLEADLHFLKGGALNLGFATLGALCQAGERAAASGAADRVDVGEIIALYAASREEFLSKLRPADAA